MVAMRIAIGGVSCSGKTTTTHAVLHQLRLNGINAQGCLQQDRIPLFGIDKFKYETMQACTWQIHNLIARELELALMPGVDVVVSDRSCFDIYSSMRAQFPKDCPGAIGDQLRFVRSLLISVQAYYKKVYLLPPLKYKKEEGRVNKKIRDEAYSYLLHWFERELESSTVSTQIQILKHTAAVRSIVTDVRRLVSSKRSKR